MESFNFHKRRPSFTYASNTIACIGIGIFLIGFGLWELIDRGMFLKDASRIDAEIVDVTYEYVPKGRGSVLAYVPTIRVNGPNESPVQVKVETYSENAIYEKGSKLLVLCRIADSGFTCIEDSVLEYLTPAIGAIVVGLAFLGVGLYLKSRIKRT